MRPNDVDARDLEKVIKGLTDISGEAYGRWVHSQFVKDKLLELILDTIPNAIALLRKQEPVNPVNVRWVMNIRGGTCPRCLNWVQRSYNYCPFCGKAVRWDETD